MNILEFDPGVVRGWESGLGGGRCLIGGRFFGLRLRHALFDDISGSLSLLEGLGGLFLKSVDNVCPVFIKNKRTSFVLAVSRDLATRLVRGRFLLRLGTFMFSSTFFNQSFISRFGALGKRLAALLVAVKALVVVAHPERGGCAPKICSAGGVRGWLLGCIPGLGCRHVFVLVAGQAEDLFDFRPLRHATMVEQLSGNLFNFVLECRIEIRDGGRLEDLEDRLTEIGGEEVTTFGRGGDESFVCRTELQDGFIDVLAFECRDLHQLGLSEKMLQSGLGTILNLMQD